MGMVKIGDRELRVLEDGDRGSFKRDLDLVRVAEEMKVAEGAALQMKFAEMVHVYVRDNDAASIEWLVENLADVHETIRRCVLASGRKPKEPDQGEAPRP